MFSSTIPTLIAQTFSIIGFCLSIPFLSKLFIKILNAIKPPVILAVLVPPSA